MSSKRRRARADAAFSHQVFICENYGDVIARSIAFATIYESGGVSAPAVTNSPTRHVLVAKDVVSAIKGCKGLVAVLDFASFKNPGGGYMNGSLAQEEAICAESTLYPVLAAFTDSYYVQNRSRTKGGLYSDRAIYVPGVVFIRDEQQCGYADVIVAAAPNVKAAAEHGIGKDECRIALKNRIDAVMSIAADNGVDTLIAGAFGCGVFGNDPAEVAGMFKAWCDEHPGAIPTVVYAVPNPEGVNYRAFAEVFAADDADVPDTCETL